MQPWVVLAAALATAGEVRLSAGSWEALSGPLPGDEAPPEPLVARRDVGLAPAKDGVAVHASWLVVATRPSWITLDLAGPEVRVSDLRIDGEPLAAQAGDDSTRAIVWAEGARVVTLTGFVASDPTAPISLSLAPAAAGTVVGGQVEGGRLIAQADGLVEVDAKTWGASRRLTVDLRSDVAPAERPPLILATSAVGVTVGEGEVRVRARVRATAARGRVRELTVALGGAGPDLEVDAPPGAEVRVDAGQVHVVLDRPELLAELGLTWTVPLSERAEAAVAMPRVEPRGVFRVEGAVQIGRDAELEVVPALPGWTPTSHAALPTWASGLLDGTPTAAYRSGRFPGDGTLSVLRFVPADGPPVVVDVAEATVALTAEGRALGRARYEVRNDRAAALRIEPPPGADLLGVTIAGEPVSVAMEDDGSWRVPLRRSVETVQGLLAFAVEVSWLAREEPWGRRERRTLALPSPDAPVAVARTVVSLPPDARSRLAVGGRVVERFSEGEGITYGFASGAVEAVVADRLFNAAVDAWMRNEFGEAREQLDALDKMGASNENIQRLQSNLAVLDGEADADADEALTRRVKEQAKARSLKTEVVQKQLIVVAEEKLMAGDYKAAEQAFAEAYDAGVALQQLDQAEEVDRELDNVSLKKKLDKAKAKAEEVARREEEARLDERPLPPADAPVVYRDTVTYDFDDLEIEGELVKPDGSLLVPEPASAPEPVTGRAFAANVEVTRSTRANLRIKAPKSKAATPLVEATVEDDREPLVVGAAAVGLVIPQQGELVRVQELLLPADAPWTAPIDARTPRRSE